MLGQSLDDLELLVVDDGSLDGTRRASRTRRRRAPEGAAESRAARPRRSARRRPRRGARRVRRAHGRRRRRPPSVARAARRADPPTAGGRDRRHGDDRPARPRAARHRPPDARGRAGSPLGGALLLAVLPLDRAARPRRPRAPRAALRPLVRRERGLRPVGATPRARGGGQPARGARPLPQASDAGLREACGAPARVPTAGRAAADRLAGAGARRATGRPRLARRGGTAAASSRGGRGRARARRARDGLRAAPRRPGGAPRSGMVASTGTWRG